MPKPPESDSRGEPSASLVAHQRSLVDDAADPPNLRGGACSSCGHRFFPFQTYGCERCGAWGEQLQPLALAGRGVLQNQARIESRDAGRESFVIARVILEPGLVIRALLTGNLETARPGTPLIGRLVDSDDGQRELRFEVVA